MALAELSGAAVITSLRERALFPTAHRLHAGPPIDGLTAVATDTLAAADVIVSFEWVDLNGLLQEMAGRGKPLPATIVHISLDVALHNGWSLDHFGIPPADILIKADADAVVGQMLTRLRDLRRETPKVERSAVATDRPAASGGELTYFDIEVALAEERGEQQFTIAHLPLVWSGDVYDYREPLDFLGHDGGAGLAAGPGITIGAALALKETGRPVISVIGDGDFMQGATALWTAAHYRLPALFNIPNNESNFNF